MELHYCSCTSLSSSYQIQFFFHFLNLHSLRGTLWSVLPKAKINLKPSYKMKPSTHEKCRKSGCIDCMLGGWSCIAFPDSQSESFAIGKQGFAMTEKCGFSQILGFRMPYHKTTYGWKWRFAKYLLLHFFFPETFISFIFSVFIICAFSISEGQQDLVGTQYCLLNTWLNTKKIVLGYF